MQRSYLLGILLLFFFGIHSDSPKLLLNKHQLAAIASFKQSESAAVKAILQYQSSLDEAYFPFYHGVASGDPLAHQVIIWTRVSLDSIQDIPVKWFIATDTAMKNIVQSGIFTTSKSRDYTVKVDVDGLQPNTTYYYQFKVKQRSSIIGRTKTAPIQKQANHLRFAVVSCNDYQGGFFNAFGRIAQRADLDAVLHLGDYIYEYADGEYGNPAIHQKRPILPKHEIVTLQDYRKRYAHYRLDKDLMEAHRQHPFICIWDDHEVANNAHATGAGNHQAEEGEWFTRKHVAKQAYFEWLPVRDNPTKTIYRVFHYGDLADIIMLDTRLEGRSPQVEHVSGADAQHRSMLGASQLNWFKKELKNSKAQWKIIGQQVVFSELNMGWAMPYFEDKAESSFLDIWDGYSAERDDIINYIDKENIEDVVILTGDIHASFAFDVVQNSTDLRHYGNGKGAIAVEFAATSISSANADEHIPLERVQLIEKCMNQPCDQIPFYSNKNPNPHLKYVDLDRHGYFILDLKPQKAQANWYFMKDITTANTAEYFAKAYATFTQKHHLKPSRPNQPKQNAAPLAPNFEKKSNFQNFLTTL